MPNKYANIIVPVPVPNTFTYLISDELSKHVQVGYRVVVQFGKSKYYTGIVESLHNNKPEEYKPKEILTVLDEHPIINSFQLTFWKWMSSYYMSTLGETMNVALPSGLKLASESKLVRNTEVQVNPSELTNDEFLVYEALEVNASLTLDEVSKILNKKTVQPIVKSLLEKQFVFLEEELNERYKPKIVVYVSLHPNMKVADNLKLAFDKVAKAPKQLELLLALLHEKQQGNLELSRPDFLNKLGAASATLNPLIKKEIVVITEKEIDRILPVNDVLEDLHELNEHQTTALAETKAHYKTKDVVLLHGVTGSGKTEIYIQLIKEALEQGKQVLYLLPEIALTSQIINRLRKFFGNEIGVFHSKFNANERVEVWNGVLHVNKFNIIIGARSALFLPYSNLGLVIIDEEHDTSFKQHSPSPRYNGRDAAIYLASLHNAKVILGSATPAIESMYNAQQNKYGYVAINKRHGNVQMPEILTADTKEAARKKQMKSVFSSFLLKHMEEAFENKEQVILFQNRRGFSPFLECETCNWIPQCKNCDVNLTYHKASHQVKCHYCGFTNKVPHTCGACGSNEVKIRGFGTEKVEEELALIYPNLRISRMDYDTTRTKNAYSKIIGDFQAREVDVLIGTQMVTKGLDFDNVSIVGILDADQMLNFQDFRAYERSYQLMSQVSGRAGRKAKRGKVIIQTRNPNHSIIKLVIANDYKSLYKTELLDRKNYHYPPFYKLIDITLKHRNENILNLAAIDCVKMLKTTFGDRILGPEFPVIPRIKNQYLKKILIKFEEEVNLVKAKKVLNSILANFNSNPNYKSVVIIMDVDPV